MSTTPTLRDAAQALANAVRGISPANLDEGVEEALDALDAALAALTQGAGEAVEPFAYAVECYPHRADIFKGETAYEFREQGDPKDAIFTAQQLQQAVARAVEECAVICEGMHEEGRPWDYAAAIRAKGTHD